MEPVETAADVVVRKLHKRLLPLFIAVVCCCYLDRTSLAFGALQLCKQEWFNPATFGFGSGVFYLGYVVFQIPSNLILRRLGAPLWLCIIISVWGLVAALCATIHSTASFYGLRLLLGIAEAGAFPGMWFVISQFYPKQYITVPFAVLEASIAFSQVVAAPVAAVILQMDGLAGLQGWQWLFITQGAATVILGIVLYFALPWSIEDASFLTPGEKEWLQQQHSLHTLHAPTPSPDDTLPPEVAAPPPNSKQLIPSSTKQLLLQTLHNTNIWYLAAIKVLKDVSLDGLLYWSPALIHTLITSGQVDFHATTSSHSSCDSHSSTPTAVLLTSVPFTIAAIATLAVGHNSEKRNEQRWHICLPLIMGGCIFALMPAVVQASVVLGFVCLTVALVSADATTGPLWTLVHAASPGETVAVSLAFVNSLGKVGGFFGPYMFGLLVHWSGSYVSSVFLISGALVAGGLLAWMYPGGSGGGHQYSQLQVHESELTVQ